MRNVIGRENLITCGRMNELAHAVRTEYSCDSFMADRIIPGPLPLFRTGSDGKLGGAWERG